MANRKKKTFSSQPDTNPRGGTSVGSTPDTFKRVNTIVTLRSRKEIDNPCNHKNVEQGNLY